MNDKAGEISEYLRQAVPKYAIHWLAKAEERRLLMPMSEFIALLGHRPELG